VAAPGGLTPLIGDPPVNGLVTLPAYGVAVYQCLARPSSEDAGVRQWDMSEKAERQRVRAKAR
jgi:hypothetical protein